MELLFQAIVSGDNLFRVILKTLFTRQPKILGNVSELKIEPKAFTFYVNTEEVQVI